MRRALSRFSDESFDVLVIGGGITGACIARDASLRGLRCALAEKGDFAGAASGHNSKLIHGGLRYLRNLELGLVRESLHERRVWQRIAPHLVQPLPFLLPVFGRLAARAKLSLGLTLYDLLAYDRGWLDDPFQRLPGHHWLDRNTAEAREPILDGSGLEGAFGYYDAQMYSPERLTLECLIDADAHGAAVANHLEAEGLLLLDGRVAGARVRDRFTQAAMQVRAKETVIAAGPWTDLFLEKTLKRPASHRLRRSKGIHVVVPAMTRQSALLVTDDRGHFFVMPWRGRSLVGTTDTLFEGNPDQAGVTERDITGFLSYVNRLLPAANLGREAVAHFYAGVRPLVDDGSKDTYYASRRAEVIDHGQEEGIAGLMSVVGGKWTTSRALAEETVDHIVEAVGATAERCTTAHTPLPGGRIVTFLSFERELETAHRDIADVAHLARLYGAQLPEVLAHAKAAPDLLHPVGTNGDIAAQIVHAAKEEMAMTLEDAVMRRTGIGQSGPPADGVLDEAARIMGAELGWVKSRWASEVASVRQLFRTQAEA